MSAQPMEQSTCDDLGMRPERADLRLVPAPVVAPAPWWAPAAGTRAHDVQRVARAVTAALVPALAGLLFAAVVLLAPAGEWVAEQLIRGWGW